MKMVKKGKKKAPNWYKKKDQNGKSRSNSQKKLPTMVKEG